MGAAAGCGRREAPAAACQRLPDAAWCFAGYCLCLIRDLLILVLAILACGAAPWLCWPMITHGPLHSNDHGRFSGGA